MEAFLLTLDVACVVLLGIAVRRMVRGATTDLGVFSYPENRKKASVPKDHRTAGMNTDA